MAYKMVDDLAKLCGRVAGAAMKHRALVTQTITERFRHKLEEGQTVPDILQLQTWAAEELYESHGDVLASESGLKAELTLDRQDRSERGRFASELRQHLFSARNIFDAIFGAGGAEVMFNEPPGFRVRVDPEPLHRQGLTVHDNILNPGFRRPPLRFDVDVDLEKLARGMEPSLEGLKRTLAGLHTGTQASNASFEAKENHMGTLDKRTRLVARLIEALYAWAGHEGLARRVRRSSHSSSTDEPSPDGDSADDQAPTPDEPSVGDLSGQGIRTRPPAED